MPRLTHGKGASIDLDQWPAALARHFLPRRVFFCHIDGSTTIALHAGLIARRDGNALPEHHFVLAAIKDIHKNASDALRYTGLATLLCPHSSPIGALLAACRSMLCVGQPLAFRLTAS